MSQPSNPYQPPSGSPFSDRPEMAPLPAAAPRRGTYVNQVRVVCTLMAVQGSLELLMGLFYGGMAFFMPAMMANQQRMQPGGFRPAGAPGKELDPQAMFYIMVITYGAMASFALIPGVLHLVAAVKNWSFKGRTFGIIALAGGALAMLTCYCGITGVALCIYGLIVYLNPDVAQAFAMRQSGHRVDAILAVFNNQPAFGTPPFPPAQ